MQDHQAIRDKPCEESITHSPSQPGELGKEGGVEDACEYERRQPPDAVRSGVEHGQIVAQSCNMRCQNRTCRYVIINSMKSKNRIRIHLIFPN